MEGQVKGKMLYAGFITEEAVNRLTTHMATLRDEYEKKNGENCLRLLKLIGKDATAAADIIEDVTGTELEEKESSADNKSAEPAQTTNA